MNTIPSSMPRDVDRSIDMSDARDLAYWSQHFGISQRQLVRAVKQVGTNAAAVAQYLGKSAAVRFDAGR